MDWKKLLEPQHEPTGDGASIADEAMKALSARIYQGYLKYGTGLHTNNGRDALADALQEQLDGLQYLVQAILEREERRESLEQSIRDCAAAIIDHIEEERTWHMADIETVLRKYFGEGVI